MRRSMMDTMSGTENNSTMSSSLGLAAADDVKVFEGGCMCKAVRFQYSYSADTKPLFVCFCHCETCRKFNSTSMQHLMGVPLSAFRFVTFPILCMVRDFFDPKSVSICSTYIPASLKARSF